MKFPLSIPPISMGHPCTLCLADGAQITGDVVYCDEGVIALDSVCSSSRMDDNLRGETGLFPLAQIRWIKPEQVGIPDTTLQPTTSGKQEESE